MNAKQAVAKRIVGLCRQRAIAVNAVNALANKAGIPPSTLNSMLNEKSQNPGIVTNSAFKKMSMKIGIFAKHIISFVIGLG